MKKLISSVAVMAMLICVVSCSQSKSDETTTDTSAEVSVTTTEESITSVSESIVETTELTETTAKTTPDFDLNSVELFEVTSENLTDGVWDDIISNTDAGENMSPQLAWEKLDGANVYVIYMIDTSAGNWMHLKATDITSTSIETGALDDSSYVGPYPPSGTHDYIVYVFALKDTPSRVRGTLDNNNTALELLIPTLDVNEAGESGNVLAYGVLPGTYSAK